MNFKLDSHMIHKTARTILFCGFLIGEMIVTGISVSPSLLRMLYC